MTLSTAFRWFVTEYYKNAATEAGHLAAGHGSLIKRGRQRNK